MKYSSRNTLNTISADLSIIVKNQCTKIIKKIAQEYDLDEEVLINKYLPKEIFECTTTHKKKRKKTILKDEEQCLARKQDGLRCTRRRKKDSITACILEFCGKHQSGQIPFGRVDDLKLENNYFKTKKTDKQVKVLKQLINGKEYYIDSNNIVYNLEGTKIIGKKHKNTILYATTTTTTI